MKKLILAFLIIPSVVFGQPEFTEYVIDTTDAANGPIKLVTGDFNNNGYEDLITAHTGSNEIVVYFNNGSGDFGERQLIGSAPDHPIDLAAADFNGDGWLDIVSISLQDDKIAWYPNQNGSFGARNIIDSGFFHPVAIKADDFNNNGVPDLVAVDDTTVGFYQNDGQGNFTWSNLAGKTEFYSIGIADINNNGFLDVMLGSTRLYTYINNGDGTFTRDTRNEALIQNFIFEIEMGDINGNGNQDMVIYYSGNNSDIDWYKNDGTGKFSLAQNITDNSNDVKSMRLADINNNNHLDFLTAYGQTGELVWMENDGLGNFSKEQVIKTYSILLRQVAATDADHNGNIDIFCGHNSEGLFFWNNETVASNIRENVSVTSALYPNPATDFVYVKTTDFGVLRVFNLQGKIVKTQPLESGENMLNINLPGGAYLFRWNDGSDHFQQKLMIK